MKKIRSYTSIWSVEKVLYSINDFKLPFPITFTQMAWFVMSVFAVMLLGNLPPLSFIDGAFLKYFGVPDMPVRISGSRKASSRQRYSGT